VSAVDVISVAGRIAQMVAVTVGVTVGVTVAALAAGLFLPGSDAYATTVAVGAPGTGPTVLAGSTVVVALAESVDEVLTNIRNWMLGIAGGVATVFATYGALRYITAAGDPGEVEKARLALRNAAFGYAVMLLAPLIIEVLKSIVGA
jgi:hypothetical protein